MEDTSASVGETTQSADTSTPTSVDAALEASFSEMSGTGEPAAPEPVAAPEAPQAPAPAIVEPVADGKGPIPFERHESAIKNARVKAIQEFQQQNQGLFELGHALQSDLPGTLAQLIQEAADHPQHGGAVLSAVARLLNGRRGRAQENVEPQPDAEDANGRPYYSDTQARAWQQWYQRQAQQQMGEQLKPLMQLQTRVQQAEKLQQIKGQAQQRAQQTAAQWKEMPFFTDHQDAILQRQQELYAEMKETGLVGPESPAAALQQAYREVVTAKAIPALQAKQQAQFIQTAVAKSRGSTSDPASSAPAQPRRARTVDEALEQSFSQFGV